VPNCKGVFAGTMLSAERAALGSLIDDQPRLTAVKDVSAETGERVIGPVAAWMAGDVEHLAGRSASGDLLVSGGRRAPVDGRWSTPRKSQRMPRW
jgi:hypothetical protein